MRPGIPPLLIAALLLGACADDDAHRQTFPALGTVVTIEIHDADSGRGEHATRAVAEYLERFGRNWYAWGDGELGGANVSLARGEAVRVSPPLAATIRRALAIRDLSEGFFDPAVGLLVEAWGFHSSGGAPVAPPADEWLASWRSTREVRAGLKLSKNVVHAPGPVKIALGGIAKGTALAASIAILSENGVNNALVDAGGDVQAIGSKGERDWRIGIRDPRGPGVLGVVSLRSGEAILSSGDYERFFELDGRRYHHLLDPHTGLPVAHTAGVTVVHTDAELADAAATALMAAGPERFADMTGRLGIEYALLVTAGGEMLMTEGMRTRLERLDTGHNPPAEL